MKDYPEHDKLIKIADKSQAIGEFMSWLEDEKGFVISDTVDLLAEYFEIDLKKIEEEKNTMIEELRSM